VVIAARGTIVGMMLTHRRYDNLRLFDRWARHRDAMAEAAHKKEREQRQ
jgi:hypothetical protein